MSKLKPDKNQTTIELIKVNSELNVPIRSLVQYINELIVDCADKPEVVKALANLSKNFSDLTK